MGYTIRIGQVSVGAGEDGQLRLAVREDRIHSAPHFERGVTSSGHNALSATYGAWGDFCAETGLRDLFFDEERGLMREHPGCFKLKAEHLERVQAVLIAWRAEHSGAVPRFETSSTEAHFARLVWLEWWMRYALETCSIPAISNS